MKIILPTLTLLMAMSLSSAFGKSTEKMKTMALTPEQRIKMATIHENMATCLRSDKTLDVCHEEKKKACMDTMGKDGCYHMMGKGKMHKMMMEEKSENE